MSVLESARDLARARPARVILPESDDPRIAAAVDRLRAQGLADPVPLDPADDDMLTAIVAIRPMKEELAWRLLQKPMYRAAAMVAIGTAEALIAGAATPTRRVIEAASICIGMASGVTTPSSFFLLCLPDGTELILADCALNVDPDAAALADIARASAASATALLGTARVALLSFSTGTSGSGVSVDKVRRAAEATGFTGPVQGDAALNPVIAAAKGMGAGNANTLIFPNLDAGNITYKLLQELAGAQAIGPFLQGFRRPVCDLSRGCSVDDIVAATVVTLALRPPAA